MPYRDLARLVAEHQALCNRDSYRNLQSGNFLDQGGPDPWLQDMDHTHCGPSTNGSECKSKTGSGGLRIHRFWSRGNWYSTNWDDAWETINALADECPKPLIPEDIYIRLVPVLELASSMLDLSDEFMARILCAPTITTQNEKTGQDDVALDPEYELTQADRIKYKQYLCQLPDFQVVCFGHIATHFGSENKKTRLAGCGCEIVDGPDPFYVFYEFDPYFIDGYTSTEWMNFTDEQIQRLNFYLAYCLVHEFAHGVGHARFGHPAFANTTESAHEIGHAPGGTEFLFHPEHCQKELGRAWAYYLFGRLLVLRDSRRIFDYSDPNTVVTASRWDPTDGAVLSQVNLDDKVLEVLADKIQTSNLTEETLARVAADGKSLELVNMAQRIVLEESRHNQQKLQPT